MSIISFVAPWIATVFLTNHYASKTKTKYWIMISLPVIYFASVYLLSFLEHLDVFQQLGIENSPLYGYIYNFFLNTVRLAGGIIFGLAFFVLSKNIIHAQLKKSLVTIGIGLVLLFGANATSLIIITTYPPWGSISTTFLIIASYFLIIGLDSAAFYLAADSSLRRIITTSGRKEHDILKALGYSETEDVITSKVKAITKQVYDEVKSDSLLNISFEPADVQNYINEVLMEVRRKSQASGEAQK
jgi:hypothetical protein